jgi:hypothetical protein
MLSTALRSIVSPSILDLSVISILFLLSITSYLFDFTIEPLTIHIFPEAKRLSDSLEFMTVLMTLISPTDLTFMASTFTKVAFILPF